MTNPNTTLPFAFKPHPFIKDFGGILFQYGFASANILDVGCFTGRHTRYLASLGHNATGIDCDEEAIRDAVGLAKSVRVGKAAGQYVIARADQLPFQKTFDAVIMNEVLQAMSKSKSKKVLADVQNLTSPGGLNAVSGYLVDPYLKSQRNIERNLQPGELQIAYRQAGWEVIYEKETILPPQYQNNKEFMRSTVQVIASAP